MAVVPVGADKFLCGLLVKRIRRRIDHRKRAPRTFAEAGAQAVAVLLRHKPRLAVHDPDGAFGARGYAQPAAVAFLLVDPDDLSIAFHDDLLKFCILFRFNSILIPSSHIMIKSALT
jgi:hypothetical protein